MAKREAWVTTLEDIVLQMQTITVVLPPTGEEEVIVEAEATAEEAVLFEAADLAVAEAEAEAWPRSQMIAGKRTRQDTIFMVIRFITSL